MILGKLEHTGAAESTAEGRWGFDSRRVWHLCNGSASEAPRDRLPMFPAARTLLLSHVERLRTRYGPLQHVACCIHVTIQD